METGRVASAGPPEVVKEDPAAVAAYLGASPEALARSGSLSDGSDEAVRSSGRSGPVAEPPGTGE